MTLSHYIINIILITSFVMVVGIAVYGDAIITKDMLKNKQYIRCSFWMLANMIVYIGGTAWFWEQIFNAR